MMKTLKILQIIALLPLFGFSAVINPPQQSGSAKAFITLKDFTKEEVKGVGFTIDKDLTIHISATGGGRRNGWNEFWGSNSDANNMYASGWIIDAGTREMVWEMTNRNTDGNDEERKCDEDIDLKKGSYEVYFQAYGFSRGSSFNYSSINIDRREHRSSSNKYIEKFLGWFDDDSKSMYGEFMDLAKDTWGISLSVNQGNNNSIRLFDVPLKKPNIIFAATGIGDNAYVRKQLTVSRDVTVHIYALGEGRKHDDMFDYGWITDMKTRDRVWEMRSNNIDYAGGAEKNVKFDGSVRLPKGEYELDYVTDGSHSREDWNMKPPYDPFNYGITIYADDENDKNAVTVSDYNYEKKNIIVQLTRVRDDAFEQAGFTLKTDSKIHIYAIGEASNDDDRMADYGWIINAKTRKRVWEMERRNTTHAGGASKNRMVDEVIMLPKGDYMVYFQTDDSHAYGEWNDDRPYDENSYGITVMGAGDNFSMNNVTKFEESDKEEGVIVQLIRVRNDKHVSEEFTLDKPTHVRVYCIGEGVGGDMADYGWIENAKTHDIAWEMTYRSTHYAGGARKNRLYDRTILLDKGTYIAHYETDDSHAYADWNDDPPEDRTHWGITIYKDEK